MEKAAKYALEIRYQPSAKLLDKRGYIAELGIGNIFKKWTVSTNKVVFGNEEEDSKQMEASISFNNLTFISETPKDRAFFKTESVNFLKKFWDIIPNLAITRIGIRVLYLSEISDFSEKYKKLKANFLALSDEDIKKFGGELIDIGFPLNFQEGTIKFNINSGLMKKEQSSSYFSDEAALPEDGLFIDLDYFNEADPADPVFKKQRDYIDFITNALTKFETVEKEIVRLIS